MSLHDPYMECTCDGEDCGESVFVPMHWTVGGYDLEDEQATKILDSDHNWLTVGENHYCESCREEHE